MASLDKETPRRSWVVFIYSGEIGGVAGSAEFAEHRRSAAGTAAVNVLKAGSDLHRGVLLKRGHPGRRYLVVVLRHRGSPRKALGGDGRPDVRLLRLWRQAVRSKEIGG